MLFRNITVGTGHGVSIGSETSGGVRNITFTDITMSGTQRGPRMKSMRGRGGVVEDIVFRNMFAANVQQMVSLTLNYHTEPPTNASATPVFRNILLQNVTFTGTGSGGEFDGLDDSIITNVTLIDVNFNGQKVDTCQFAKGTCQNVSPCPPCFQNTHSRGTE